MTLGAGSSTMNYDPTDSEWQWLHVIWSPDIRRCPELRKKAKRAVRKSIKGAVRRRTTYVKGDDDSYIETGVSYRSRGGRDIVVAAFLLRRSAYIDALTRIAWDGPLWEPDAHNERKEP